MKAARRPAPQARHPGLAVRAPLEASLQDLMAVRPVRRGVPLLYHPIAMSTGATARRGVRSDGCRIPIPERIARNPIPHRAPAPLAALDHAAVSLNGTAVRPVEDSFFSPSIVGRRVCFCWPPACLPLLFLLYGCTMAVPGIPCDVSSSRPRRPARPALLGLIRGADGRTGALALRALA